MKAQPMIKQSLPVKPPVSLMDFMVLIELCVLIVVQVETSYGAGGGEANSDLAKGVQFCHRKTCHEASHWGKYMSIVLGL